MKKLIFLLGSVAMLGFSACGGNGMAGGKGDGSDSLSEEDMKAVETMNVAPGLRGDSVFVGIICDGTDQNTLILSCNGKDADTKDTVTFLMDDDVDKSNFNGLVEGGTCEVVFNGDLKEKPKVTYIETYATYSSAIGRWSCEDPEDKDKKIGFELKPKGKVDSYLPNKKAVAWQMYDDRSRTLFITISKKNGTDDVVAQISEDGKTITIENDQRIYTKEKE